eukprot:1956908-Pyramimonas_sp.AAC.1
MGGVTLPELAREGKGVIRKAPSCSKLIIPEDNAEHERPEYSESAVRRFRQFNSPTTTSCKGSPLRTTRYQRGARTPRSREGSPTQYN